MLVSTFKQASPPFYLLYCNLEQLLSQFFRRWDCVIPPVVLFDKDPATFYVFLPARVHKIFGDTVVFGVLRPDTNIFTPAAARKYTYPKRYPVIVCRGR